MLLLCVKFHSEKSVMNMTLNNTRITGRCAIVEYESFEDSQRAIDELNGTHLEYVGFRGNRLLQQRIVVREDRGDAADNHLLKFHRVFCETQSRASRFAEIFNSKLLSIPALAGTAPRVSFLECSVYIVKSQNEGRKAVLVEKQLDPVKYKKWNGNNGFVDGQDSIEQGPDKAPDLLDIIEASEDEQEDENDDAAPVCTLDPLELQREIPQAFSCFTFFFTQRRMLVCDLQGVLDTSQSPPLFEFTDPVIHYKSRSGDCSCKCTFLLHVANPTCEVMVSMHQVARMCMGAQTWA